MNKPTSKIKNILLSKKTLLPLAALLIVVVSFQNCGKGFQTLTESEESLSSLSFDVLYSTKFKEAKDDQCLGNGGVDACVYFKNPTEATASTSNDPTWIDKLQGSQKTAVQLALTPEDLHKSGTLTVMDSNGIRLSTHPTQKLRFGAVTGGLPALKQIMIHYWFQKTMSLLGQMKLSKYLHATGLKVIIDAPVTGWVSERNVIVLGEHNANSIALDGSIFVQLLGEAMIYHATQGRLLNPDPSRHKACFSEKNKLVSNECCTSINGCSKALTIGISDYLSSMIFYNSPALGDFVTQNGEGIHRCGISRNPIKNQSTTFQDAYNACDKLPALGHMYTLGSVFSASLFHAYKEINTDPVAGQSFQTWIFDVSSQITNEDDFISFYKKLESREPGNYNRAFSKALRNQLNQRGLNIPATQ